MDKLKKAAKPLKIKCSTPYSQSWNGMAFPKKLLMTERTCPSKNINRMDSISRRLCNGRKLPRNVETSQHDGGLDPTAPHLKYGIFPKNKKLNVIRGQSHTLTVKPPVRTATTKRPSGSQSTIVEHRRSQIERKTIAKVPTTQKFLVNPSKPKGEPVSNPMFFVRPVDQRNICSLSISASNHLDIKPRPQRSPNLSPPPYKRYL